MKLTGKLKIFNAKVFYIGLFLIAILCCLCFFVQPNYLQASAAENSNSFNVVPVEIISSINTTKCENRTLIKKGTDEFLDGGVYQPRANSNGENLVMTFNIAEVEIDDTQAFYVWTFIPEILMHDLVVILSDNNQNFAQWKIQGTELSDAENYDLSITDMIEEYGGNLTRGWKLLKLSFDDAVVVGEFEKVDTILIDYSFIDVSETADDQNFAISYPFFANKNNNKSEIVDQQEYIVFADKVSFLEKQTSIYLGDKIILEEAADFFSYAIVGNQNILDDSSGYVWNVVLSKPSGAKQTLSLDRKREIVFDEQGYYLIDIRLTTSKQDSLALIGRIYNVYSEPFAFGYFQKANFNFENGSKNMMILTLSDDFELLDENSISFSLSDKNSADLTYYLKGGNVCILFDAKKVTSTKLFIEAQGYKTGQTMPDTYQCEVEINISEVESPSNYMLLKVIFCIMIAAFAIYLVILVVKARRFSVK